MKKKYLCYGLMIILIMCASGLLVSCSVGGGEDEETTGEEETPAVAIRLGSFSAMDDSFVEGELALSLAEGQQLAAGGTATVTATVVDSDDALYTAEAIEIAFTSPCVSAGTSEIDETVTTNNGSATATYRADGCEGLDTVTATANTGAGALVATATIDVAGAALGSIEFVSADPKTIALKGTGGADRQETSVVTFRVVDENGNPAPNVTVNFVLSTEIGGLSLSPDSAQSDSQGNVQVVVTSGNVPTSVRVEASVDATAITTVSDELVISTGLPDQNSFSISAAIFNPEGWNYDGATVDITIRAADHFNNPVPDGTAIAFTTEGGAIEPFCTMINGGCTVTWTSQNPRPTDGLVTILATGIGEESFIDVNANGFFDAGDTFLTETDLAEAFRDDDEDGTFDPGTEEFLDFNADGLYTVENGMYNGVLCSDLGICTDDLVHVREDIVIVMSGSFSVISFYDALTDLPLPLPPAVGIDLTGGTASDIGYFYVIVADVNGNSMPNGTTVSVTSTLGQLQGDTSFTVTNTLYPARLDLSVQEVVGGVPSSWIEVEVTSPNGNISEASIIVLDDG